jgi:hypothetical protein
MPPAFLVLTLLVLPFETFVFELFGNIIFTARDFNPGLKYPERQNILMKSLRLIREAKAKRKK